MASPKSASSRNRLDYLFDTWREKKNLFRSFPLTEITYITFSFLPNEKRSLTMLKWSFPTSTNTYWQLHLWFYWPVKDSLARKITIENRRLKNKRAFTFKSLCTILLSWQCRTASSICWIQWLKSTQSKEMKFYLAFFTWHRLRYRILVQQYLRIILHRWL